MIHQRTFPLKCQSFAVKAVIYTWGKFTLVNVVSLKTTLTYPRGYGKYNENFRVVNHASAHLTSTCIV